MQYFEWDEAKDRRNKKKHGISFEVAAEVFSDPFAITNLDQQVEAEERLRTIGRTLGLVLIVVIHLIRTEDDDEILRIISARAAGPVERATYEETHD
jgi:uncharacterized DUF497 family protein